MKVQVNSDLINKVTERFIELQLLKSPTSELFLRDLITRKIILFETMKQYCIVHDFETYLKANKGKIQDALFDFEDDYNVSSRTIRRILTKCRPFC